MKSKPKSTKRLVTGVKPSGFPHLGNYLGAIRPAIELQNEYEEAFFFIADLHSLTTVRNAAEHREYIRGVALDFLALGLDPQKVTLFRQSDLPEHAELSWILSCITPFGLMDRAHAWKDAVAKKLKDPTVGLFTYPVLMAADILLYQANIVPVGKDQKQHVEIARDLADKFNHTFGETFTLPEPSIPEEIASIPGTDGTHKMSKSYKNTIEIFGAEEVIRKQIMGIKTDSKAVEEPKDPDTDTVFKLYCLIATATEIENLRDKYLAGGFGYGEAKKLLANKYLEYFAEARQKRIELTKDLGYLDEVLATGAQKAKKFASQTLTTVKKKVGLLL